MQYSSFQPNDPAAKTGHEPNPKWITSVKDLPTDRSRGPYLVTPNDGEPLQIKIKNRKRQVVDALIFNDLYCASTVRIGDIVFRLKEDKNLFAETKTLTNGRKFYTLNGTVKYVGPVAAGKGGK